ncbi:hypothetical protein FQA47_020490 [Oryzias melastigma]|uniref:Uncharacterized protein n=1 Tax=Oryzias melastigma TaxID=30732 RepID=A0A834CDD9_ORYME|nr:hypothetical protein FQA47_020490 [Oryzias melastigma]
MSTPHATIKNQSKKTFALDYSDPLLSLFRKVTVYSAAEVNAEAQDGLPLLSFTQDYLAGSREAVQQLNIPLNPFHCSAVKSTSCQAHHSPPSAAFITKFMMKHFWDFLQESCCLPESFVLAAAELLSPQQHQLRLRHPPLILPASIPPIVTQCSRCAAASCADFATRTSKAGGVRVRERVVSSSVRHCGALSVQTCRLCQSQAAVSARRRSRRRRRV